MSMFRYKYVMILGLLFLGSLLLAACATPTAAPSPEPVQACPTPAPCPTQEPAAGVPFQAMWVASGHAKADSEAFRHWDNESPAEIPAACAKCHSETGFLDYVGADGSEAFKVDKNAPIGTVVTCNTCHNEATAALTTVKFPSGAEITGLGREAVCMTCHQGNASMVQVDEAIQKAGATDEDKPVGEMGFVNIHYFAAAVSRYGTEVKGGYEYAGQSYDALFDHVTGVDRCTDCHDSHSLELKVESCTACHQDVKTVEDVRNIRMVSSMVDYDGDGNVEEGVYYEIEGLRELLYTAIQAYAKEVAGTPIVYTTEAYPYFFIDTNADGKPDADETAFPNKYASWTPRLEKAAYNFQTATKDPGGYAHGGKYIIQLLYDSIANLNEKLSTPVDLSKARREDPGHFAGSSESFRHWDEEGVVARDCVKCHTGPGLPQFLKEGVNISMPPSNGLLCETCHDSVSDFTIYKVEAVTFPVGASLSFEGSEKDNLCLNCHQGRESTLSVNRAIAGLDADKPSDKLGFRNIHYFAAGATLFGTEAKGVYEYDGKEYAGRFEHIANYQTCTQCHDTHGLQALTDSCKGCHTVEDPTLIRLNMKDDYDGDKDVAEGVKGEIDTMQEELFAAIQKYAKDVVGTPIVYSKVAYPYFFIDKNDNGEADPDEAAFPNRYNAWTPRLLKAAYNYQYVAKDPGGYVHNPKYLLQVLYDSLADIGSKAGVSVSGKTRP